MIAAILAGGRATRLGGRQKGMVPVRGRRIVDRQLEVLRPLFGRVVLVTNDPEPWRDLALPTIADRLPGAGPLAGIDAVLAMLAPHETAAVCIGGDMPFLVPALVALVRDHQPQASLVVPHVDGRPQPLLARWHRSAAEPVSRALAQDRRSPSALAESLGAVWLAEAALRAVDPTLCSFDNVNTFEDLARLEAGAL